MKTHIEIVGLIDVVVGVLFTTLGVLVSVGGLLFTPAFNGAPPWSAEDAWIVVAAILLVSALFLVVGIPSLIAGMGLRRHKRWAPKLAIIVAILALFSFPVGTAVGLYTLWALSSKEALQQLSQPA